MSSKKILVFSTYDYGGAGESAYRLTQGIAKLGYETTLIVRDKSKSDRLVLKVTQQENKDSELFKLIRKIKNKILINKSRESIQLVDDYCFYDFDESKQLFSSESILNVLPFTPDIILFAWVSDFINTKVALELQKQTKAKAYWIMTDMGPITGGCHYAWDCEGYTTDCHSCPAILTVSLKDRAERNLALKKKHLEEGNFKIIAGSGGTLTQAKKSILFRNQPVYPLINGLVDFTVFNNNCRSFAKQIFNIPQGAKVIFCGATFTQERRKGIILFAEALNKLYNNLSIEDKGNVIVLIAGNYLEENELVQSIPFQVLPIDFIKDNRLLSLAYQAANIFVCPSVEDAGPMMVNESLACGTPVIGFDIGMLQNMVQNGFNGYKVMLGDTTAMANAIAVILALNEHKYQAFSFNAIEMVKKYASLEYLKGVMDNITDIK